MFENFLNGEKAFESESQDEEITITKTEEETDKKCPNCHGILDFDPKTRGLICPYCGYTKTIETTRKSATELDFNEADCTDNCNWGIETKTVICKSCGAETVYDNLEISGTCPYCGSNQVMEAKEVNTLAPGGVCIFKKTEQEALENFEIWLKRKIFCPTKAKESVRAGKLKGIYLPYWTFDTDTSSFYTGKYGIDRRYKDIQGQEQTDTDWYKTSGYYTKFINDELVIATTNHNNSILKGLEPFNTEDNVSYKPEYIAGFGAERYSIGLKDAFEKAKEVIKSHLSFEISQKIKNENSADKSIVNNINTTFSNVTYKYLLLPVWISSFQYKGKIYQFMVNGQTGKVSGKTPISALKVTIAIILAAILIGLIIYFYKS